MAGARGNADGVGGCLAQAAPRTLGAAGTVVLGRPGTERLRGQRRNGGEGMAAPATGMPGGAAADSERPGSGEGELPGDQSIPGRCRSGSSVADTPGPLAHRKPGALGNRVHWVRDVTFDEDRSQIRTGSAPQVMAALRNLTTTLVRRAGHSNSNVAAALRRHAVHLSEALALLGIPYTPGK